MKTVSISELESLRFTFEITDIFPEKWERLKSFSLYKDKPRPCSALFFVCSDMEVSFFLADGRFLLTAKDGDVVYIPVGANYYACVEKNADNEIGTYTVNLHFQDEHHKEFVLADQVSLLARRNDNFYDMHLKNLYGMFYQTRRNLLRINGETFLLLDELKNASNQDDKGYYPIRNGVKAFCEEWNKSRRVDDYAQIDGVSVTYFYRCFRRWSGKSPVEYRNALRLANAESLLRCTDMKVQEISEMIGFDNQYYFCRLFRERYGSSPKQYRNLHRT